MAKVEIEMNNKEHYLCYFLIVVVSTLYMIQNQTMQDLLAFFKSNTQETESYIEQ